MSFLQVQDLLLSKHIFISPPNAVKLKALSSFSIHAKPNQHSSRFLPCFAVSKRSSDSDTNSQLSDEDKSSERTLPMTKPRKKRRRGRRSEADAVEDFIRNSLDQTFTSIRNQNPEAFESVTEAKIMKQKDEFDEDNDDDDDDDDDVGEGKEKEWVVEEECDHWPVDADVGWGIRASEYFEKHSIKNVVGEDGLEIDWEGESDDSWVKEINCLEWESIAFHPSPLIVLVFERCKRASDNWKILKELEGAFKVYWKAKDRLPPRAVKIDINIERDLAYALKVKEGPQLLFLRGSRILYREKEIRTTDELVHMIAYFYYNAKKPSWIDDKALSYKY